MLKSCFTRRVQLWGRGVLFYQLIITVIVVIPFLEWIWSVMFYCSFIFLNNFPNMFVKCIFLHVASQRGGRYVWICIFSEAFPFFYFPSFVSPLLLPRFCFTCYRLEKINFSLPETSRRVVAKLIPSQSRFFFWYISLLNTQNKKTDITWNFSWNEGSMQTFSRFEMHPMNLNQLS